MALLAVPQTDEVIEVQDSPKDDKCVIPPSDDVCHDESQSTSVLPADDTVQNNDDNVPVPEVDAEKEYQAYASVPCTFVNEPLPPVAEEVEDQEDAVVPADDEEPPKKVDAVPDAPHPKAAATNDEPVPQSVNQGVQNPDVSSVWDHKNAWKDGYWHEANDYGATETEDDKSALGMISRYNIKNHTFNWCC